MKFKDVPNSILTTLIDEWIKGEIDRAILKDRYINAVCYEPLAEKYDLSVATVKRKVAKGTEVISMHLQK